MARIFVKSRICDRCPVGRERTATRFEFISLGDSRYKLELCEECGSRLDREFYAWARLGEQVEDYRGPLTFTREVDVEQRRHTADLRAAQSKADRIQTQQAPVAVDDAFVPSGNGLPVSAGKWVFSKHAIERLTERKIRVIDALRAASQPKISRRGEGTNIWVHRNNGIHVVVNRKTMEILTVAHQEMEDT